MWTASAIVEGSGVAQMEYPVRERVRWRRRMGEGPRAASEETSGTMNEEPGTIVVLNRDLFFGVKIGNAVQSLGFQVEFTKDAAAFAARFARDCRLGVIDIAAVDDWAPIAQSIAEPVAPTLAFGPHMDVDGLRAAKRAGVTRVVANSDFHRQTAELIARYAANGVVAHDDNPVAEEPAV